MSEERLGVGTGFLSDLGPFAQRADTYDRALYERAAAAIDKPLNNTLWYMEAQERKKAPPVSRKTLVELWQEASRVVAPLDFPLSQACLHKAAGWIKEEDWAAAHNRGINTDIPSIRAEREKLIHAARLSNRRSTAWKWIDDPTYYRRLTVLGTTIASLAGAFVYFDGKDLIVAKRTTFQVCMGEFANNCKSGSIHISCGSNLSDWAKNTQPKACYRIDSTTQIQNDPGNQCGYSTLRFECRSWGL